MPDCDAYQFFNQNTGFVLTLMGILGAGFSGLAMCILKSRCSSIKCCCIECQRNVLSEEAVTELGTDRSAV